MNIEYAIELAKGAYEAYGGVTDHKNYQGLPMPEWDALTDKIKEAWMSAAEYVSNRALADYANANKYDNPYVEEKSKLSSDEFRRLHENQP